MNTALLYLAIIALVALSGCLYFGRVRAIDRATTELRVALEFAARIPPERSPGVFCELYRDGNQMAISMHYPAFAGFRARMLADMNSEAA